MNNIIKKTIDFINILDDSKLIKDLTYYKEKLLKDEQICNLIELGNNSSDDRELQRIKKELYYNNDYKNYIDKYNEVFYLVLRINNKYNSLLNTRSCLK